MEYLGWYQHLVKFSCIFSISPLEIDLLSKMLMRSILVLPAVHTLYIPHSPSSFVSPPSLGPLPYAWEPEGPAKYLSCC